MKLTAVPGVGVTKHENQRRPCKDALRKYWKGSDIPLNCNQPISVRKDCKHRTIKSSTIQQSRELQHKFDFDPPSMSVQDQVKLLAKL